MSSVFYRFRKMLFEAEIIDSIFYMYHDVSHHDYIFIYYIYIYLYIIVYIYIYLFVYIYICIYIFVYIYIYLFIYPYWGMVINPKEGMRDLFIFRDVWIPIDRGWPWWKSALPEKEPFRDQTLHHCFIAGTPKFAKRGGWILFIWH